MDRRSGFFANFPTKCEHAATKWILHWCVILVPWVDSFTNLHPAEFELGLELDSAEVRGILLYQGQEWGRVVFDFLN